MQTLTLIQIILSSKLDSYSRTVIWNSSKYSVVAASRDDIEICKAHTDLKGSDLLTNNLSHKRDMNKPHGCWIHYNHMVM